MTDTAAKGSPYHQCGHETDWVAQHAGRDDGEVYRDEVLRSRLLCRRAFRFSLIMKFNLLMMYPQHFTI